jgi:hypothetical protein
MAALRYPVDMMDNALQLLRLASAAAIAAQVLQLDPSPSHPLGLAMASPLTSRPISCA